MAFHFVSCTAERSLLFSRTAQPVTLSSSPFLNAHRTPPMLPMSRVSHGISQSPTNKLSTSRGHGSSGVGGHGIEIICYNALIIILLCFPEESSICCVDMAA
uniref:Uncharacterized protein n=1 Tax=Rhizophora mucronata TaxID=61149 RepID=A0A2P2MHQ3_RHIMU